MAFRRGPPTGAVGMARDGCSRSGGACGGRSRGGSRCLESLTAGVVECVTSKGAELLCLDRNVTGSGDSSSKRPNRRSCSS